MTEGVSLGGDEGARLVALWPRTGLFPAVDENFGSSFPLLSAWTGLQAITFLVLFLAPAGISVILYLR